MTFKHIARCPVCKTILDVIETEGPKLEGLVESMLLQPEREKHARKSPECTKDNNWCRGWELEHV